jgi:hypothetical protein
MIINIEAEKQNLQFEIWKVKPLLEKDGGWRMYFYINKKNLKYVF